MMAMQGLCSHLQLEAQLLVRVVGAKWHSIELLKKYVNREFISQDGLKPTKLFSVRNKTEFVNKSQYDKIKEPEFLFEMKTETDLF